MILKNKYIILFLLFFAFPGNDYCQDSTITYAPLKTKGFNSINTMLPFHLSGLGSLNVKKIKPINDDINYGLLAGVGAITIASGIGIHIYQANAWWKDQRSRFRFVNDWNYALWLDKIGHFYGANLLAHGFSSGLEAGNVHDETAAIYSAIASFAFELYIEIEDGFGPKWGFSPGDAIADFLGSAYFLAQYYYPYLKNFQPRVSYWPSEEQRNGLRRDGNFIDDYHGQKYWIGMRMKEILPKSIAEYWPSILMISVGMGVKDLNGSGGGTREFYVALDLDAEKIPLHGKFWQFLKNTLNYIHFPMPGIRVTPDAAFFVFLY